MTLLRRRGSAFVLILLLFEAAAQGQRIPKPGFNFFSKAQDIEIGKTGAAEIEKKLKLVTNREVVSYIQSIGRKLAQTPEAGDFPFTFKVVQDNSINAFALPGGPVYINTGLILAADNEAQLAGVIGHEMSHVALRHGTNQASKANLLQIGAMMGGTLLGGGGSIAGQLAQLGIGFGANSVLMKFSRGHERDADLLGARMMARVGYNPIEAARFFEKLQAEGGKRSGVQEFFSDHPNPGHRVERIKKEIPYFPKRTYNADSGKLPHIQAILRHIAPPGASAQKTPSGQSRQMAPGSPAAPRTRQPSARAAVPAVRPPLARPSSKLRQYRGREFVVSYPANWQVRTEQQGASVTIVPPGGRVEAAGGGSAIGRGIVVSILSDNTTQHADLEAQTKSLISQIQQRNQGMRVSNQGARRLQVGGSPALLTTLYSPSAYGGETEIDMLLTLQRPQGLFMMVFISPQSEFRQHQPTFEKVLNSIRFTR